MDNLQAVNRPFIMRAMDAPGRIPIIGGIPVGIIRAICGIVGAIFAGLGALVTFPSKQRHDKCIFAAKYLLDEAGRGITEVFCYSYIIDKQKDKWEKQHSTIMNGFGAYGKYIYETPDGDRVYSRENYDGKQVTWTTTYQGSEHIRGVQGKIQREEEE